MRMIKLTAMWKLMWANHFLLVLGQGGWIGVTPKDIQQITLMRDLADKLKSIEKDIDSKEKKNGAHDRPQRP